MADFTIRIHKAWNSSLIERAWSNTYEVISSDTDVGALMATAQTLVDAEQNIHLTPVHFLEYTISTWVPDSHPYDPDSFVTVALNVLGARPLVASINDALDYNVCFVVRRQPQTGRVGRCYYRGCLLEQDVQMGGDGRWILAPATPSTIENYMTSYHAEIDSLTGMAPIANHLAMIGLVKGVPGLVTRRNVVSMQTGGITVNKRNHKYFDRV